MSRTRSRAFCAVVLAQILGVCVCGLASAGPLASHRALYELQLGHAAQSSSVNGAHGRLVVEWQDTCDGFTTNQRLFTEIMTENGGATVSDIWLSSWEARDGSLFRFTLTSLTNGNVDERVRGEARPGPVKGAATKGGLAVFAEPKGEHLALPKGVLFPTAHMQALIEAARSGQQVLDRSVFDGSRKGGLSEVNAFIGRVQAPGAKLGPKGLKYAPALVNARSWPVRLAFFSAEKPDSVPDYEFAYRMYENGVATGLVFDYGDFVVDGVLKSIEPLPGCDGSATKN